jgi:hypothetical protein
MDLGTVLGLVVVAALAVSAVLFAGAFELLEQLGQGGLSLEDGAPPSPPLLPASPTSRMEREEEIRQFVQARHDRQLRRGEQPLDVEAEVSRLLEIDLDAGPEQERQDVALREEVRQLVVARNERRLARGEPPLDVEAEIERQLRSV